MLTIETQNEIKSAAAISNCQNMRQQVQTFVASNVFFQLSFSAI